MLPVLVMKEDTETCQRCGEKGHDRRTLWMACFYQMDEIGLPFKQVAIKGEYLEHVGDEPSGLLNVDIPKFERTDGKIKQHNFYQLRVCKKCRSDWLMTIAKWFIDIVPEEETGTGIYIRKLGNTVEISKEEYEQLRKTNCPKKH